MIDSDEFQFSCVWRSGNILVLFLWRQHNWVERYRTIENGRNFLFEYIITVSKCLISPFSLRNTYPN